MRKVFCEAASDAPDGPVFDISLNGLRIEFNRQVSYGYALAEHRRLSQEPVAKAA